jgi:tripeptide aminopeptidase
MTSAINAARVLDTFLELVRIDSPTFHEQAVADWLVTELGRLGIEAWNDRSGPDGTGNVIGRLPSHRGTPIAFSAHTDTVQPGFGVKPVVEDGVIRTSGDTILGADDKAGIVAIIEALRVITETGRPHPPIELLFTWGEEGAHRGAKLVDVDSLTSKVCFVPDAEGPVGTIIGSAPSYESMKVRIKGVAAHAGMEPEKGRSAIVAAARAIASMPLGRIDHETTCNVGLVTGGSARNAVPASVEFEAEARSRDDAKLDRLLTDLQEAWSKAAAESGCEIEIDANREYRAYRLAQDDLGVRLARTAATSIGVPFAMVDTGGGSDANTFWEMGLPSVCLSSAFHRAHSVEEHMAVADLEKLAAYVLAVCDAAAAE